MPPLILEATATGEKRGMIGDCRMMISSCSAALSLPIPIPRGPPANAQFALRGRRGLAGRTARLLGGNEGGAEHEGRLAAEAAEAAEAAAVPTFLC